MRTLKSLAVALLATVGLLSSAAPAPASVKAAAAQNHIANWSNTGIGVIHNWDNNYTHGNYDVVLPAGHTTLDFWDKSEGFFIGAGYCGEVFFWHQSQGSWVFAYGIRGSRIYGVDTLYSWSVNVWHC